MFNEKEFIEKFVAAAKDNDEKEMKNLAENIGDQSVEDRVTLLENLIAKLKETKANEEVTVGLTETLHLMKHAVEAKQTAEGEENKDSTVEEAKDDTQQSASVDTKAEEATKDVAADDSADEADEDVAEVTTPVAESDGEAPAEEEKAEKSEA